MTAMWQSAAALLWLMTWWVSPPATLADAARKEAIRRQTTPKAVASLSNLGQDLQEPPPAAVTMPPPPDAPPPDAPPPAGAETKPGAEAKPGAAGQTKPGEAGKEPERTESYWRGRINDARAVLDRDITFADALQAKINGLQRDAVNLDDPIAQARARNDLSKALADLDKVNQQIKAGQQQVADIQAEARRLNIPAGWVR